MGHPTGRPGEGPLVQAREHARGAGTGVTGFMGTNHTLQVARAGRGALPHGAG
jgi:hypothetical protein